MGYVFLFWSGALFSVIGEDVIHISQPGRTGYNETQLDARSDI